jgi:hypothetical protein
MSRTPEMLALQQVVATCRTHHQALGEALEDLRQRALNAAELERLCKEDRRLLVRDAPVFVCPPEETVFS